MYMCIHRYNYQMITINLYTYEFKVVAYKVHHLVA